MPSTHERQLELFKYEECYKYDRYRMGGPRAAAAIRALAEYAPGSFLDVGCGRGELLVVAETMGFGPVRGLEAVSYLCDGNRVVHGNILELPFQDLQFDTVGCFDVMEHLLPGDEDEAIRQLWSVTNRRLLLSISNIRHTGMWLDPPQELHINIKPYDVWTKVIKAQIPDGEGTVKYRPDLHPGDDSRFWEVFRT